MNPNVKPSAVYPAKGTVPPQSIAAAGNAVSAWMDAQAGLAYLSVILACGALGGGTLSVDVLQATSNAGAGAKDLVTGLIVGAATNNGIVQADVRVDETTLDINNGFRWVQIKINNVGGTGALASATAVLGPARFLS